MRYPGGAHAIVMATLCSVHAHCLFRDTRSAHGGALEVKDPVTQEIPRVSLQSWYQSVGIDLYNPILEEKIFRQEIVFCCFCTLFQFGLLYHKVGFRLLGHIYFWLVFK